MPPRIQVLSRLRPQNVLALQPAVALPIRTFTSCPQLSKAATRERAKYRDPYSLAQSRARKAANISRQQALKEQRQTALGDPVRGTTTPFVQSFDSAVPLPNEYGSSQEEGSGQKNGNLKHFLHPTDVEAARERSERLTQPSPSQTIKFGEESEKILGVGPEADNYKAEKALFEKSEEERQKINETAKKAIERIVSLEAGNSKDRMRKNIERCINVFGRHNTDKHLPPKPTAGLPGQALPVGEESSAHVKQRAGADTGSSEVQIAILTAKIRALAHFLETRGKPDKVGKRSLRLLVHKRQKLLKYLRRSERGGPRWKHITETLGLTEGTWKGEISL